MFGRTAHTHVHAQIHVRTKKGSLKGKTQENILKQGGTDRMCTREGMSKEQGKRNVKMQLEESKTGYRKERRMMNWSGDERLDTKMFGKNLTVVTRVCAPRSAEHRRIRLLADRERYDFPFFFGAKTSQGRKLALCIRCTRVVHGTYTVVHKHTETQTETQTGHSSRPRERFSRLSCSNSSRR